MPSEIRGSDNFDTAGVMKALPTAWVNFNATGAILDSYNILSVTKIATGKYTVVFENGMDNANYVAVGMTDDANYNASVPLTAKQMSQFDAYSWTDAGGVYVDKDINLVIFGGKN